jgi:GT2 family glycosyltransferase
MKPVLSLIVLGYGNFESVTKACLESLVVWGTNPSIEILVVDNGSLDNSAILTARWCAEHAGFRCLLSDTNRGFAGGMNWGASYAAGEWLLLVNNDTVFPVHALDAFLRVVEDAPVAVAMLGPVTNAAGNGQRLWNPSASHADWLQIGEWINDHPTGEFMPTYRCDFFCIAIRKVVWDLLGGLDTAFGLGYYEDFDFSLRLRKAGFEQAITEDVFVLHVGSATFGATSAARNLIKRNKKLLREAHPDARFEHTRLGNIAILERYVELLNGNQWTSKLQQRLKMRLGALTGDAPRSLLKRLLWKLKTKKFKLLSKHL